MKPNVLHVAAAPYPSPQGTQALLRQMLTSLADASSRHHLFTYGHGDGSAPGAFPLHRLEGVGGAGRGLRSGPSVGKALTDVAMVHATRRLARALDARVVVAHNVEAALVARAAAVTPVVYMAHTSFDRELPSYFPRLLSPALRVLGGALDALALGTERVISVSPALTARLRRRRPDVDTLLPPWPVTPTSTASERAEARARLGLPVESEVMLYAGNLDAYQGWEDTLGALAALGARRRGLRLLVATASDPAPLWAAARDLGVPHRLHLTRLDDEPGRRAAHAAADLALVPRRVEGGLPIKLLDAFARSIPVVTTRRALSGLDADAACLVCPDDDPVALAHAADRVLTHAQLGRRLAAAGRFYVESHHTPCRFVSNFERLVHSSAMRRVDAR